MIYVPQFLSIASVFLLGAMSPGPDFFAVTSRSLVNRRAGLMVASGVTVAIIIWASLAMFGLGVILTRFAWLYTVVRLAGAAYLLYLGIRILLSVYRPPEALAVAAVATPPGEAWRSGFLIGITNPKTAAFFGSLFVTVLPFGAPLWVQATTVLLIGGIAIMWFGLVALVFSTGRVRAIYNRIRRPIDALLGTILVMLGLRLALMR